MTKIKICGLTRPADIAMVNKYRPDYVGFVFADSKRKVSGERAAALKEQLDSDIETVGVFVNEKPEMIAGLVEKCIIDLVQLHGNESSDYIKALKTLIPCKVIKALRVKNSGQLMDVQRIQSDYLLLDAYSEKAMGGTGESFDWQLLDEVGRPYFLAGGLDTRNVKRAVSTYQPYAVDVSSGVETMGVKDEEKIKLFIAEVRKA